MPIENTTLDDRAKPLGNYPHVKRVGDFIYVSGTSSRRPDNTHEGAELGADGKWVLDIEKQTRAVIENIATLLEAVGSGLNLSLIHISEPTRPY